MEQVEVEHGGSDATDARLGGAPVASPAVTDAAAAIPLGTGTTVFANPPVTGTWRMLDTPDDVLDLMDSGAEGIVAGVQDAGATFLAPIFHELTAVVCFSGTPMSHIGIVSREYRVPCIMATEMAERPANGTTVEVDCTAEVGAVRSLG